MIILPLRQKIAPTAEPFRQECCEFLKDFVFFVLLTGDYEGRQRETYLWTSQ